MPFAYVLRCSDGSYYVGSTSGSLEHRVNEHGAGVFKGYTSSRLPIALVWSQEFQRITDAIAAERQIKGWGRAKKEALIRGDFASIQRLASRRRAVSSFETEAALPPQDDADDFSDTQRSRHPEERPQVASRRVRSAARQAS